jgi:hypothetical protein
MKKLLLTLLGIGLGIVLIPALFAFAIGVGGTVMGFIAQPRVMLVLVGILAIISLPGIIIGLMVKK